MSETIQTAPIHVAFQERGVNAHHATKKHATVMDQLPPHVSDIESTRTYQVEPSLLIVILALTISVGIVVGPLPALTVLTLCGVHLVYTHLWAIATILAVCDRTGSCHGWMGVLTAMGIAITVPWYGLLVCRYKDDTVGRAISGWGRWITEDICGCVWPYDSTTVPILIRLCYHLVDLAVHFLPTPWLLSRYDVTAVDCVYAFAISRLWSISATAHHLTLDWRSMRNGQLRICARTQSVSPFAVDGVINDIYGLRPTLPSSSLHFLYSVEAVTLLVVALAGAPSESVLLTTQQIEGAMVACVLLGAAVGLVGMVSLVISIRKHFKR